VIESGKYAISGLGMVIGLPEKDLQERQEKLGTDNPYLRNAISSPLHGLTARDLEAEAARRAIEDAGLTNMDIDGAVHVYGGPRSGRGMLEQTDAFPRMLGLPVNFYYRAGRGGGWGTFGLTTALSFLELGIANYVVVAGSRADWTYSHRKEFRQAGYKGQVRAADPAGMWGPAFGRIQAAHEHSMLAVRHMHELGTKPEQFGLASTQIREWGALNPLGRMYGKHTTLEDYLDSPMHIWPYHFMDMAVTTDGAVAFVLTTTERARSGPHTPVKVAGVGMGDAQGGQWQEGAQHYTKLPVPKAKERAFATADITIDDLDMAQLYDCFTGEVLLQLEGYGWCGRGEAGSFLESEGIGRSGKIPVNTGGGLLSAYHMADLTGISESVIQLRHDAGERQVADAKLSMVTGHGGEVLAPGMCSIHSCLLLERG
jgi:acetyl-CoA acetyltransferase